MARNLSTFRGIRISGDLDQAFLDACNTAGVGPSEMLRTLIAEWTRGVHEARNVEAPGSSGRFETPTVDGRPERVAAE